ncbi:hypothetical protein AAG747_07965 [Rapidithrix thailandica]|uniref:Uncharacterized protein n=1 Tax=Rapidithrix thailandica TaxID=413964 RepID=A0AAW9SAR2_9BACT
MHALTPIAMDLEKLKVALHKGETSKTLALAADLQSRFTQLETDLSSKLCSYSQIIQRQQMMLELLQEQNKDLLRLLAKRK